jgi:hypothetical protein
MDPQVEAALIGAISGGVTGILVGTVGIVGTLVAAARGSTATREATAQANETALKTTQLTLAAEHNRQLWERRAELYVDIMRAAMVWANRRRQGEKDIPYEDFQSLLARVSAFASDEIREAFIGALDLHFDAVRQGDEIRAAAQDRNLTEDEQQRLDELDRNATISVQPLNRAVRRELHIPTM